MKAEDTKQWDVFISHASEDKATIVAELVRLLEVLHLKVWYDESSLSVGDSLSKSIDEGLKKSSFGIVIITNNFIRKGWADYEYRSLLQKEINGKKIILPIWHNITKEEVAEHSLFLSDKIALDTSKLELNQIALKLLTVIRPDIARSLKSYLLLREVIKNGTSKNAKISEIKRTVSPRSKLSKNQIVRAKTIFYGIGREFNQDADKIIIDLEFDLHPEYELQAWEIMNLCYLEFVEHHKEVSAEIKKELANTLVRVSEGICETTLPDKYVKDLIDLWEKYSYKF